MKFHWRKLVNGQMIWGAILGLLIAGSFYGLLDTWQHRGSGWIGVSAGNVNPWYGDSGDHEVKVSEVEYKRSRYVGTGLILGTATFHWLVVSGAIDFKRSS
ncbi:MAG TPA: hypothetical protein VG797_03370, partial [Phycisphaerales bacterium]|nr:hypothetical protein [Phycisphaerales bacterium]